MLLPGSALSPSGCSKSRSTRSRNSVEMRSVTRICRLLGEDEGLLQPTNQPTNQVTNQVTNQDLCSNQPSNPKKDPKPQGRRLLAMALGRNENASNKHAKAVEHPSTNFIRSLRPRGLRPWIPKSVSGKY